MRAAAEEMHKAGVKVGDAVSEALKSMEESELMRAVRQSLFHCPKITHNSDELIPTRYFTRSPVLRLQCPTQ